MDTAWILKYLTGLNEHNNREWYNAHKAETKEATEQFEELVQALILRIGEFDSSVLHIQPKDTAFTLIRYPPGSDRTGPHIIRYFAPILPLKGSSLFRWDII